MSNTLQTLFTGRQVTHLEKVNSTNNFIHDLLAEERFPEGSVVLTREQSMGRGQAGARWVSEPGKNLLMTVIFYPSFLPMQNLFLLSKSFSLGVYDAVKEILKHDVKIKWPNDIYFRDTKLCGILIENSIRNQLLNHTLLGIGLNVNQDVFPKDLPNPASLKMILRRRFDLNECFNLICNTLERRYLQLKAGHLETINKDYIQAAYRFGEYHEYKTESQKFRAKIIDFSEDGKIVLKHEDESIEKYDIKEVKFVL